jgi:hypothetical protein
MKTNSSLQTLVIAVEKCILSSALWYTSTQTKMTAFWDIAPCSLIEVDHCYLHTRCRENLKSHLVHRCVHMHDCDVMNTISSQIAHDTYVINSERNTDKY